MCFTVNVNLVKEELENRYGATLIDPDKYRPSYYYHAFGLPELPAICAGSPDKITLLKWGLIPSWIKTADDAEEIRFKTFNARSESIENKPSFTTSFKTKRCILPVQGFYEWQHIGKEKIPWYIYHSGNEILSLAGLYSDWVDTSTGSTLRTFTIITTEANDLMAEIHNSAKRMPVILVKSDESRWLDISASPADLISLLKPSSDDLLKAYTIDPLVNDKTANRNDPVVIRPYVYGSDNRLF
jgi:putative SOS response-associated peptidase YedK